MWIRVNIESLAFPLEGIKWQKQNEAKVESFKRTNFVWWCIYKNATYIAVSFESKLTTMLKMRVHIPKLIFFTGVSILSNRDKFKKEMRRTSAERSLIVTLIAHLSWNNDKDKLWNNAQAKVQVYLTMTCVKSRDPQACNVLNQVNNYLNHLCKCCVKMTFG